ncbi:unnamed protein product [Rotaria sordida]|uniref:Uncharacterized protein n=1 Tax=Rotaria sordida TaxID=392033 RepID=A0A814DQ15_9BILA|nr:unnamed protein product [Rotaria sordida]
MRAVRQETSPCYKEVSPCFKEISPCFKETSPCYKEVSPCFKETSPCFKETSPCIQSDFVFAHHPRTLAFGRKVRQDHFAIVSGQQTSCGDKERYTEHHQTYFEPRSTTSRSYNTYLDSANNYNTPSTQLQQHEVTSNTS